MDITRSKEIVHSISDGADPLTGEVLTSDHVCNQADVIRALHTAEQALQKIEQDLKTVLGIRNMEKFGARKKSIYS